MTAAANGAAIIRPTKATKSGSTQTGVTIGRRPSTATRNSNSRSPSGTNRTIVTASTRIEAARIQTVRAGGMTASAAPVMASANAHSGAASGAVLSKPATIAPQIGRAIAHAVAG